MPRTRNPEDTSKSSSPAGSHVSISGKIVDECKRKRTRLSSLFSTRSRSSKSSKLSGDADSYQDKGDNKQRNEREIVKAVKDCAKCRITVTEGMRLSDIASGTYDPKRTPAYVTPRTEKVESVNPFDRRSAQTGSPTGSARTSRTSLKEDGDRYQQQTNKGTTEALKRYAFDRHVQEHQHQKRSFLNMCRDEEDVDAFRFWSWIVVPEDGIQEDGDEMVAIKTRNNTHETDVDAITNGEWPRNNRSWQNQVRLWLEDSPARKKQLDKCRRKWKRIKAILDIRRSLYMWRCQCQEAGERFKREKIGGMWDSVIGGKRLKMKGKKTRQMEMRMGKTKRRRGHRAPRPKDEGSERTRTRRHPKSKVKQRSTSQGTFGFLRSTSKSPPPLLERSD